MANWVPGTGRKGIGISALGVVLVAAFVLVGCADAPGQSAASSPNDKILQPAQQALTQASSQRWSDNAPAIMGSARSRLATARSIVYQAASEGRDLTNDERERVEALVKAVKLDRRAAKARGSAVDIKNRLAELKANQQQGANVQDSGSAGRETLKAAQAKRRQAVKQKSSNQQSGSSRRPQRQPPTMSTGPGAQPGAQRPANAGGIGR
ncbi:hypothetical protein HKX42_07195 [Salinisphaera sp. USBA-960]|uniref:hypothetical protein n=1 Tax=Salinisphaera orenii TaxID=856731 RepID=UPI000DBE3FBC|nr:hypothetical protein [Salifodinibacter halophilus]NNC26658.1 hypothetical protein [Salifodinibacter halophilus]